TVHTTPMINSQPMGATVGIGANHTFTVGASGGGLSYQWYKGIAPMSDGVNGNGTTVSGSNTNALTLTNIHLGDAGSYSCVVSNNCGSATSNPAVLNVNNEATLSLIVPPGCQTGTKLVVSIYMSGATTTIVGGQYFLQYNTSVLQFNSANPGDAPFTREIYENVNQVLGTIDYATGIEDGGTGTMANTVMARISFNVLQDVCSLTPNLVTWRASGPNGAPNQLSDPNGDPVTANTVDLGSIKIDTTGPSLM